MKTAWMIVVLLVIGLVGCKGKEPVEASSPAAARDENPPTQPDSNGVVVPPGQESLLLALFSLEGSLPAGWTFDGATIEKTTATITYKVGGKSVSLVLKHPDVATGDPVYKGTSFVLFAADGNPADVAFEPLLEKLRPVFEAKAAEWKWTMPKSLARKHEMEAAAAAQPEGAPAAQPEGAPAAQPEGAPAAQPEGAPAAQPEGAPAAQPEAAPAVQPAAAPAAQPEAAPAVQPAAAPAAQPAPQGN